MNQETKELPGNQCGEQARAENEKQLTPSTSRLEQLETALRKAAAGMPGLCAATLLAAAAQKCKY